MDVPSGYLHLSLTFPADDEARLVILGSPERVDDPHLEFAAGLDGIERFALGSRGIVAAGTGEWLSDNTFMMDVDTLGNLDLTRLTFVVEGDGVTVTQEDPNWWEPDETRVFTGTCVPGQTKFTPPTLPY